MDLLYKKGDKMEITEIIKDAFVFPSNNIPKLALYIVLVLFTALLLVIGVVLLIWNRKCCSFSYRDYYINSGFDYVVYTMRISNKNYKIWN